MIKKPGAWRHGRDTRAKNNAGQLAAPPSRKQRGRRGARYADTHARLGSPSTVTLAAWASALAVARAPQGTVGHRGANPKMTENTSGLNGHDARLSSALAPPASSHTARNDPQNGLAGTGGTPVPSIFLWAFVRRFEAASLDKAMICVEKNDRPRRERSTDHRSKHAKARAAEAARQRSVRAEARVQVREALSSVIASTRYALMIALRTLVHPHRPHCLTLSLAHARCNPLAHSLQHGVKCSSASNP